MSFKREGDDWSQLNVLKKRRVGDLLASYIPEAEALMLRNGCFAYAICPHRPVLDTLAMLTTHCAGKKHLSSLQLFNGKKKPGKGIKQNPGKQNELRREETKAEAPLLTQTRLVTQNALHRAPHYNSSCRWKHRSEASGHSSHVLLCQPQRFELQSRKINREAEWFNLNSLLTGPELISDTYLALFLAQLQQEGYSIFVVKGDLPDCEADQLLQMIRVQQMHRPKLIGEELAQLKEQRVLRTDLERVLEANDGSGMLDEDEEDLQRALALSRQEIDLEDEEADLRRAIQLSMQGSSRNISQDIPQTSGTNLTSEELRKRRETYFEKHTFTFECFRQQQQQQQKQQQVGPPGQVSRPCERPTTSSGALGSDLGDSMSEEDMLQAAVTMSLETVKNNLKTEGKK
ncbi:Ataxin-3 [Sciurus carolinensis]|uniref:ubiquitinyl hydrolase 1 n=1 Tax=Sciurus carolinensis TaxID=30640 RepID=A0AA41MHX7_SCICA|nr:Ataxin-3 [Sciurus carolinensis]